MIRALSLQQPWAEAVLRLGKMVENGKWKTNYRGFFLIHSSKSYDREGESFIRSVVPDIDLASLRKAPRGSIVGAARLADCVHISYIKSLHFVTGKNPWAFGPWCFALNYVKFFVEPVPCRGMLNFFKPPLAALEALEVQAMRDFGDGPDISLSAEIGEAIENLK